MRNRSTPYSASHVVLTTKHGKSCAIAPPFEQILGAFVKESPFDTDTLGTFSGEVDRAGTALECARRKCELGMSLLDAPFGIASEGSFGPHPNIPFVPCGHEILYFIDLQRNFHLHVNRLCERTNYRMKTVASFEELRQFAEMTSFPSHALVIRPNEWKPGEPLFKGVQSHEELKRAFHQCQSLSSDGLSWVETDMRAHLNPTRMSEIGELAGELAHRLATLCPACHTPGWGQVKAESGLPCEYCDQPTPWISHQILGCVLCSHHERQPRSDGLAKAPQRYCHTCNP